jgi:small-conductance mechanosensitive channel
VIRHHSEKLTARVVMLAQVGLFILWLSIAARGFGIQRALLGGLASMLGTDLTIGTVAISLGDILAFAIVLWLSLILARGIRLLLEEDVLQSVSLPRGVPAAISTLVYYAAVFIGFLMAAAAAGFDLSRFTLLAGAFGVGLGFGLQNVVNNFVSGLILIFERPIQVGDTVEVGGIQGQVQRIGIRASTVRTWSGAEVIVPNGDLISQQVTNWTLSDRLRRMEIAVGVKYGTDPQRVIDLLTATVIQHPEVLPDPAANAIFQGFGQSSLDFVVRAWTTSVDWRIVASDLTVAVNSALKEAGIEIPFPQRDLHLRSVDAELKLGG